MSYTPVSQLNGLVLNDYEEERVQTLTNKRLRDKNGDDCNNRSSEVRAKSFNGVYYYNGFSSQLKVRSCESKDVGDYDNDVVSVVTSLRRSATPFSVSDKLPISANIFNINYPYRCAEVSCQEAYRYLDWLMMHEMAEHNKLALFRCKECRKRYTTK